VKTRRRVGVHYQGDLRQEMTDAAVAALAEVGADHVSLRDVARRAGVSHGAPAHHFDDKAGMLTAVALQGFQLFLDHLRATIDGTDSPLEALDASGRAYLGFSDLHPGHFDIMFRPQLINTDAPDYKIAANKAFALLSDLVAACQRQGWQTDADTTTLTVSTWALFHGLALLRCQGTLADHLPDTAPEAAIEATRSLTGLTPSTPLSPYPSKSKKTRSSKSRKK
jgi:AcrR family transcriptional regulator